MIVLGFILVSCSAAGFIPVTGAEPTITPTPPDWGNVRVTVTNPGLTNIVVRVLDNPWVDTLADDGVPFASILWRWTIYHRMSPGYYIATQRCSTGKTDYEFTLAPYGMLSNDFVQVNQIMNRLYIGSLPGANTEGTDIAVTCSPVFSQSQFCAPCHYAKFWDIQIYNSYGEWLDSPYADAGNEVDYKTCQACHMVVNNGTPEGDTQVKTSSRQACS